jgi:hypothetical protein
MQTKQILAAFFTILLLPATLPAAEVRGIIANVDLKKGELVLDKVVLYGKESGTLKDLPVGRQASVEFEERDSRRVVTAVHVNGRPPAVKMVADNSTMSGTLRRVALTDREIVVIGPGAKGPETETTLAVPESARVLRDGKAIPFDELKEGEKVAVTAEKRAGHWTANAVQVGMVVAAPAAKESNVVPRIRLLLRIADRILQQMDKDK